MAKNLTPAEEAFLAFDWAASQSWQHYYSNLYPTPPLSKLAKYKRTWFRREVDSTLPMDSVVGDPEPRTTSSANATTTASARSRQQQTSSAPSPKMTTGGVTSENIMKRLEITLRLIHLVTTLATMLFRHLRILPIGTSVVISQSSGFSFFLFLVIAIIRANPPRWSVEWAQRILLDDNTHYLSYGVAMLGLPKTIVCAGPQLITCVIGLNKLYKQYPYLFPYILKTDGVDNIFNTLDTHISSLFSSRASLEVMAFVHLIISMIAGNASFLNVVLYMNFLKLKLSVRDIHLHAVLRQMHEFITRILSNPMVPPAALGVYSKLAYYTQRHFCPPVY